MRTFTTHQEFIDSSRSEKIGLVQLEATTRAVGWVVDSGTVFKTTFTEDVVLSLEDSGVALNLVGSVAAITPGDFFFDRNINILFAETTDSVDPNTKFMGLQFRLFFSNVGINLPNDLATGFEVHWIPQVKGTSNFGLKLDNRDIQLGFALEGAGSISLNNDQSYWIQRYDKFIFENQTCRIFSYNRTLPISEAQLIYRGRIQSKNYSTTDVTFKLKDHFNLLRAPVGQGDVQDFIYTHPVLGSINARVKDDFKKAKQRIVYGRPQGVKLVNIDQVTEAGYPLTGTFDVTNGSPDADENAAAALGVEVFQDDEIIFAAQPDRRYTVDVVSDANNQITLTENYVGPTTLGTTAVIFPAREQKFLNRHFLIAGHKLRKVSTTISQVFSTTVFRVVDPTDIIAGDQLTINAEVRIVKRVEALDFITITQALTILPVVSDAVVGIPIKNVFLNDDLLLEGSSLDYTVDADTGVLELNKTDRESPEFRVAPIIKLKGRLKFTLNQKVVTTDATGDFLSEIKPGDWIKAASDTLFRQVQAVFERGKLDLCFVFPNSTTSNQDSILKSPEYFTEGESILSGDLLGKTVDGLTSGRLLRRGPECVRDIIVDSGNATLINEASFTTANELTLHEMGFAIPQLFDDNNPQTLRTQINRVNQSIFGSLFQNNQFEIEYSILDPTRNIDTKRFIRSDLLDLKIKSDSTKIAKEVELRFNFKEHERDTGKQSFQIFLGKSKIAEFLCKTQNRHVVETVLTDLNSSCIFAQRWVFLLELSRTLFSFRSSDQTSRLEINDRIEIDHEKIYERIGSTLTRKIGLVREIKRNTQKSMIVIDDLGNAFSRCGSITKNDARDFNNSSNNEIMAHGFITDNNGMQGNDQNTFFTNVIW